MKDKCVLCGKETQYDVSTHIDLRLNYIEGAGQLCDDCGDTGRAVKEPKSFVPFIKVPASKIKELSNDYDLGRYVRTLYNKTK